MENALQQNDDGELTLGGILLEEWLNNITSVSVRREGDVFIAQINENRKVIIKSGYKCLYTEYVVGETLNNINSPNLVKTLGYYEVENFKLPWERRATSPTNHYLILEYIKGITLKQYLERSSIQEGLEILITLIDIIINIQSQIDFTHYDLHLGNILITDNFARSKIFKKLIPVPIIIDFGQSHVPGLEGMNSCIDGNRMGSGRVPAVFDPVFDITTLLQLVLGYYGENIFQKRRAKQHLTLQDKTMNTLIKHVNKWLENSNFYHVGKIFGEEFDDVCRESIRGLLTYRVDVEIVNPVREVTCKQLYRIIENDIDIYYILRGLGVSITKKRLKEYFITGDEEGIEDIVELIDVINKEREKLWGRLDLHEVYGPLLKSYKRIYMKQMEAISGYKLYIINHRVKLPINEIVNKIIRVRALM